MSTLQSVLLGDIAHVQTGPFGSQLHQSDYVKSGVPIVTVEHLGDNRLSHVDVPMVSPEDYDRLSKYILRENDIVFSRVGSVDRRALVRAEESGWLFSGRCLRVRPDPLLVDAVCLSYYFGQESFKEHVRQIAVGATMPSLNTGLLSEIELALPPLEQQLAIGKLLGSLDDKIELNRQTNETLEEMARTIFRSWFVDFDPVRIKARGGDPVRELGISHEVAALFPDSFEDSELGEIPTGWGLKTIGEVCDVVGGGTPSTSETSYWDGEFAWATPRDMSRLDCPIILSTERTITREGLQRISSGLLPTDTVLMSSRAPIGYLAITKIPIAINQGFIALKPTDGPSSEYLINWCAENMDAIKDRANGSTFMEISKSNFRPMVIVDPGNELYNTFTEVAGPLYELMTLNSIESVNLSEIRDYLLPKLISGQIKLEEFHEYATL